MKTLKLSYIEETMEGCVNDDYNMICRAARIVEGLATGRYDIEVEPRMRVPYISSLYRKYMRAFTRFIIANPNMRIDLARDCNISSTANGEYIGIFEAIP